MMGGLAFQGLGQLGGLGPAGVLVADGGDHVVLVVDLLDGILTLLVQHGAIGDHDDRVEQAIAGGRAQADQVMRRPRDGAGFATAGRVSAQVRLAGTIGLGVGDHPRYGIPLVEAREDQRLLLVVVTGQADHILLLGVDEAVKDSQPVVTLADLFPEMGYRVFSVSAQRVARMAVAALVEGQEVGVRPGQLGRHLDVAVGHREVNDRAALEGQQRLDAPGGRVHRQTVILILFHRRVS